MWFSWQLLTENQLLMLASLIHSSGESDYLCHRLVRMCTMVRSCTNALVWLRSSKHSPNGWPEGVIEFMGRGCGICRASLHHCAIGRALCCVIPSQHCRVTVVGSVCVSCSIFLYSNKSANQTYGSPQHRKNSIIVFFHTEFDSKLLVQLSTILFAIASTQTYLIKWSCSQPCGVSVFGFAIVFAHRNIARTHIVITGHWSQPGY